MKIEQESNWSVVQMLFAGILMFVLGSAATGWVSYKSFVEKDEIALQHSTWMQVPARVLSCQVYKVSARYRNQSSHEWLQVRYSYYVDGVRYESDTVGSMDRERLAMFREASQRALASGVEPSAVLPTDLCCYVNPEYPSEAKLFTDAEGYPWWWIILQLAFYGGFALTGLWGIFLYLREVCRRIGRFFRRLLK